MNNFFVVASMHAGQSTPTWAEVTHVDVAVGGFTDKLTSGMTPVRITLTGFEYASFPALSFA